MVFDAAPESAGSTEGARPAPCAPLDILFVTSDQFPPFRPAAKAIFADGLAERGYRIDWIMPAADATSPVGAHPFKGGTAYIAPTDTGGTRLARLRKHWAQLRNDLRVFELVRTRRYALVQVKDKYLGALFAIAAAKIRRVPVFYWLAYPHGEASLYAARSGVARYGFWYSLRGALQRFLLYNVIMPACEHVFVQSEQMRIDVAHEGIPPEKMTAVPSSIKLEDIDAAAAAAAAAGPEAGADDKTIVYLGTLLRERRLDFLVRALARVLEAVPAAKLVFVGRGEMPADEQLLRREAERLGVAHAMRITGWLPMPLAWQHARRAAVCVSPYFPVPILRSTSPTKLVEYMALGKAVVANDHPEQSEVIEQSGAGVVCGWDEEEFADAIVELLENPERAAAMGRAGREFVAARRTHWAMVDLVAERYQEVLADRTRRGAPPAEGDRLDLARD
ncbi:MAG TPA: glycosyltransferase [Gammaproteobacteria bacterium]|nr:glycosyltransferase [Gammaproteobacteria bacterium]